MMIMITWPRLAASSCPVTAWLSATSRTFSTTSPSYSWTSLEDGRCWEDTRWEPGPALDINVNGTAVRQTVGTHGGVVPQQEGGGGGGWYLPHCCRPSPWADHTAVRQVSTEEYHRYHGSGRTGYWTNFSLKTESLIFPEDAYSGVCGGVTGDILRKIWQTELLTEWNWDLIKYSFSEYQQSCIKY